MFLEQGLDEARNYLSRGEKKQTGGEIAILRAFVRAEASPILDLFDGYKMLNLPLHHYLDSKEEAAMASTCKRMHKLFKQVPRQEPKLDDNANDNNFGAAMLRDIF